MVARLPCLYVFFLMSTLRECSSLPRFFSISFLLLACRNVQPSIPPFEERDYVVYPNDYRITEHTECYRLYVIHYTLYTIAYSLHIAPLIPMLRKVPSDGKFLSCDVPEHTRGFH